MYPLAGALLAVGLLVLAHRLYRSSRVVSIIAGALALLFAVAAVLLLPFPPGIRCMGLSVFWS